MSPDFEKMAAELDAAVERAQIDVPTLTCKTCEGRGYHHGFGEDGHDPDWCSMCGGSTFVVDEVEYERRQTIAVVTILKQLHDDTLERAAVVADERESNAVESIREDRDALGKGYDVNSYGAGYDSGARDAGWQIAERIRSLKSPDSGGAK